MALTGEFKDFYSRAMGRALAKKQDEYFTSISQSIGTLSSNVTLDEVQIIARHFKNNFDYMIVDELKSSWFGREQAYIRNLRDIV